MENIPGSPFFPYWAERVAEVNDICGLKLLTVKTVDASDISAHHDGFVLPRDVVEDKLVPYLTFEERDQANLFTFSQRRRDSGATSIMWNYDGLNVSVFVQGGWRLELLLTHNSESGHTVIRGTELELLRRFGKFRERDSVAIWMFRYRDDVNNKVKFCFCLVKIDWALVIAETSEYNLRLALL